MDVLWRHSRSSMLSVPRKVQRRNCCGTLQHRKTRKTPNFEYSSIRLNPARSGRAGRVTTNVGSSGRLTLTTLFFFLFPLCEPLRPTPSRTCTSYENFPHSLTIRPVDLDQSPRLPPSDDSIPSSPFPGISSSRIRQCFCFAGRIPSQRGFGKDASKLEGPI